MGAWYEGGLRFECTMCGACCSGPEGYVLFTDEEARAMAAHLSVPIDEFMGRFTRDMGVTIAGRRRSLREVQTDHGMDCVFLDRASVPGKALCSLHEARPLQCRTFPFWPDHLKSRAAWDEAAQMCEGIGRGAFVPVEEIRIQSARQRVDRRG